MTTKGNKTMELINNLIEPNLRVKNYYESGNSKHIYEDRKPRYIVAYSNRFFQVNKKFDSLDEAKAFKRLCDESLAKAKYNSNNKITTFRAGQNDVLEYPENLLKEIKITDEEENYYTQILPNFEYNYSKVKEFLNEREIKILDLRLKQFKTLEEVGKVIGVTRDRIRQIEYKALMKIKARKNIFYETPDTMFLLDKEQEQKIIKEIREKMTRDFALNTILDLIDREDSEIILEIQKKLNEVEEMLFLRGIELPKPKLPINETPIEELELSVRAYNCLKRADRYLDIKPIKTIGDIPDEETLMKVRNLGRKSLKEVLQRKEEFLRNYDK